MENIIALVIQAENHRLRPALTFVHPSATSVSGFALVCCRNKFFATVPKGKKGCSFQTSTARLSSPAVFSGVPTSSQSTKTKRSAKDILRKPNHSCLFSHQEAKPLCQEHEENEGSLVGDRIWRRSVHAKSCSPLRESRPASSFLLLLPSSLQQ